MDRERESLNKKTVYDPTIISDDEIVRLGEEAMEEGLKSSRVKYLEKQGKEKIQGVSSTGLKFEGFRDINTGEITNFYPILK